MSLSETQSEQSPMEQVPTSVLQGLAPETTVITERTKYLIEKQGISHRKSWSSFCKAASIEMRERFTMQ